MRMKRYLRESDGVGKITDSAIVGPEPRFSRKTFVEDGGPCFHIDGRRSWREKCDRPADTTRRGHNNSGTTKEKDVFPHGEVCRICQNSLHTEEHREPFTNGWHVQNPALCVHVNLSIL